MTSTSQDTPTKVSPPANLPVGQLESLKFKSAQIVDSIYSLQWTIENYGYPGMPAWPDILSKYNVLLSQTLNLSNALVQPPSSNPSGSSIANRAPQQNIYERIAVHPAMAVPDAQLDGEVIPLLRNQQTLDVLRAENDTVKRLAEHMATKGSLAVLGITPPPQVPGVFGVPRKPEYEDVLKECNEIKEAHDRRVERAVRAVNMLKDKFDWKQRVEVAVEEPEELGWDPRFGAGDMEDGDSGEEDVGMASASEGEEEGGSDDEDDEDETDAFNIQGALVNGDAHTPAPPSSQS